MSKEPRPEAWLPLAPVALHALLALAEQDLHGYALLKEIRRSTAGGIDIGASTLYSVLRRLEEGGLVEEATTRPRPALDDERRRYFRLAPFGRRVLLSELQRLDEVLAAARALHPKLRSGRA